MIGNRLKQARRAAGLSLRDLQQEIRNLVTAQAIGKYERDEMMPSSDVLLALARATGVSPEFLMSQRQISLTGVDFRKEPAAGGKDTAAVEAKVLDQVERYLALEDVLPDTDRTWSAPADAAFRIESVESAEAAAKRLRNLWGLGTDPIPQLAELLEDRGIKVVFLDLPVNVSGSKAFVVAEHRKDIPVIVTNVNHTAERQRFTLAHELAHLVLNPQGLSAKQEEDAANRFAGAFLIPADALRRQLGQKRTSVALAELLQLKGVFATSIAALVVRCGQASIVDSATYQRMYAEVRRLGLNDRHTREPNPIPPETSRRMERLCLRALEEGAISEAKAASLLRLRVSELEARRQAIVTQKVA
jgi:Zn-dependent peptidase ImmA (M78 family)/transcriptional regulator with XRE-family HTH domain